MAICARRTKRSPGVSSPKLFLGESIRKTKRENVKSLMFGKMFSWVIWNIKNFFDVMMKHK